MQDAARTSHSSKVKGPSGGRSGAEMRSNTQRLRISCTTLGRWLGDHQEVRPAQQRA